MYDFTDEKLHYEVRWERGRRVCIRCVWSKCGMDGVRLHGREAALRGALGEGPTCV